jgi:hypothetical protein
MEDVMRTFRFLDLAIVSVLVASSAATYAQDDKSQEGKPTQQEETKPQPKQDYAKPHQNEAKPSKQDKQEDKQKQEQEEKVKAWPLLFRDLCILLSAASIIMDSCAQLDCPTAPIR